MAWLSPKQLSRIVVRLRRLPTTFWHLPLIVRIAMEVSNAQDDVAKHDYVAAQRRLLRLYNWMPAEVVGRSPVNLLMALVCLRLGNSQAAADLAPTAIGDIRSLRYLANPAERAYLSYAGRLIYEEATLQLGSPKTLDVGVEFGDLDVSNVSKRFVAAYPVHRSPGTAQPQLH